MCVCVCVCVCAKEVDAELVQMTAPLLFICFLYIIHDAFPCRKQCESFPAAQIRGRNVHEH